MRWTIYLLMLCGVALHASAQTAANPKLFKSYAYDAPVSEFAEKNGYYDCSAEMGGTARCKDNVAFLDHDFTLALQFVNRRLTSVVLASDFDHDLYLRVFGALQKTFSYVLYRARPDDSI